MYSDSNISETNSCVSEESKDSLNLDEFLKNNDCSNDFISEIFNDMIPKQESKCHSQSICIEPPVYSRVHKIAKERRVLTSTPTVRVIKIEQDDSVSLKNSSKFLFFI